MDLKDYIFVKEWLLLVVVVVVVVVVLLSIYLKLTLESEIHN